MSRLLPLLRLLRVGTLFSPAADVVASSAIAGLPWSWSVVAAVCASACLYAAGMVWNDVADRKSDALLRPERPLPRGDVSLALAIALGTGLVGLGLWLSPCRGYHGLIACLVLAYDFAGKRIAWLGVLGMGTLRALNLAVALAFGGEQVASATSLFVAAACYGFYIVAVTILGIFEDLPRVSARAVTAVQTAPPLCAFCGLCVVQGHVWPAPVIAAVPILWFLRRNARTVNWDQAAIRRSMTFLLLGTMLYTALLALAAGRLIEAIAIGSAILPARWIARRIALT